MTFACHPLVKEIDAANVQFEHIQKNNCRTHFDAGTIYNVVFCERIGYTDWKVSSLRRKRQIWRVVDTIFFV